MRRIVRLLLVLLLPFLFLTFFSFARMAPRQFEILAMGPGGNEVTYFASSWVPESPHCLVRDFDGGTIQAEIPSTEIDNRNYALFTAYHAGANDGNGIIAVLHGMHLYLYNAKDLTVLISKKIFESPQIHGGMTFSQNGKYLFVPSGAAPRSNANHTFTIFDTRTLETTWELTSAKQFYSASNQRLHLSIKNAQGAYQVQEVVEFETGNVRTFKKDRTGNFAAYSSDGSVSIEFKVSQPAQTPPLCRITNLTTGQVETVDLQPGVPQRTAISPDQTRALTGMPNESLLIDLENGKLIRRLRGGGVYLNQVVGSNCFALLETKSHSSWPVLDHYLSFLGPHVIRIYDSETDVAIREFTDHRPIGLYCLATIAGLILWPIAWLWSGWTRTDTSFLMGESLLVTLLVFSACYLRVIYGGNSLVMERTSAIMSLWFMASTTSLISVWLAFATELRASFRIPIALAALIYFWIGPLYLWEFYQLPQQGMPIGCMIVAFFVLLCCGWLRWRGWMIVKVDLAEMSKRELPGAEQHSLLKSSSSLQVALQDFFVLPAVVGLLLITSKFLPFPAGISYFVWTFYWLIAFSFALVVMTALWAGFSRRSLGVRIGLGFAGIVVLSALVRIVYFNSTFGSVGWHVAVGAGTGTHAWLVCVFLRRAGWRFQRLPGKTGVA